MQVENTISTSQAARLLKVSKPQVHWLVQVGKLSATKRDGRVWLDVAEVATFAETYKPDRGRQRARAERGELSGEKTARIFELMLKYPHANVDDIARGAKCSIERVCRVARFRGMSVEDATKFLETERVALAEKREKQAKEEAEAKEAYLLKRDRANHEKRVAAARAAIDAAGQIAAEREALEKRERRARLNEDGPIVDIARKLAGAPEALAKVTERFGR